MASTDSKRSLEMADSETGPFGELLPANCDSVEPAGSKFGCGWCRRNLRVIVVSLVTVFLLLFGFGLGIGLQVSSLASGLRLRVETVRVNLCSEPALLHMRMAFRNPSTVQVHIADLHVSVRLRNKDSAEILQVRISKKHMGTSHTHLVYFSHFVLRACATKCFHDQSMLHELHAGHFPFLSIICDMPRRSRRPPLKERFERLIPAPSSYLHALPSNHAVYAVYAMQCQRACAS
jgi:hypothetical protein